MQSKIIKKYAKVDTFDECVACGSCAKYCPKNAITIKNGIYAEIDENICIGCGRCKSICPASVIKIVSISNLEEV